MKKKKQPMELSVGTIVAIVLLLSVLILLMFMARDILEQPELTITEEVCEEKIEEVGMDYFNEGNYGNNSNIINYTNIGYGFYKLNDLFCINYLKQQGHKDFLLQSCEYYPNGVGLDIIGRELIDEGDYFSYGEKIYYMINPEKTIKIFPEEFRFDEEKVYLKNGIIYNDNKNFYFTADVYKGETTCSQVEVDEIEIFMKRYSTNLTKDSCCIGCDIWEDDLENFNCLDKEDIVKVTDVKIGTLKKQDLTIGWLENNCECSEKECTIFYNKSQRLKITSENMEEFISKTYDGPIEYIDDKVIFFEKGAQVVEECESCQEYKCGDYFVKIE